MDGPDFFILFMIAGILALCLAACMLTGAVWLFFGWRKKCRSVQFLSVLPFGIGTFVVAPLLFSCSCSPGFAWLLPPGEAACGRRTIRLQARPGLRLGWQLNITGPACLSRVVR